MVPERAGRSHLRSVRSPCPLPPCADRGRSSAPVLSVATPLSLRMYCRLPSLRFSSRPLLSLFCWLPSDEHDGLLGGHLGCGGKWKMRTTPSTLKGSTADLVSPDRNLRMASSLKTVPRILPLGVKGASASSECIRISNSKVLWCPSNSTGSPLRLRTSMFSPRFSFPHFSHPRHKRTDVCQLLFGGFAKQ